MNHWRTNLDTARLLFQHEAASGVILLIAAVLAMLISNSPANWLYGAFLDTPVSVQVGALAISKPLLLWVNDGLMAIFFFLVGLELKREFLEGHLSSYDQAVLPALAAVGGMAVPSAIYLVLNWSDPVAVRGWAIPAATDIAFALGVLALLGSRVPTSLKVFLLTLAILDDLGAIVIIALFYTADLSMLSLVLGGAGFAVLLAFNFYGVTKTAPYIIVGLVIWICVLKSGVHATLAGVLIALVIPLRAKDPKSEHPPLIQLEHGLKPWVAFGIMPLFAFANAGVPLAGISPSTLFSGIPLGIALGLFIGKQVGVLAAVWACVHFKVARLPTGASWQQIYGVALLTGIGFTMSLFIGTLAFVDGDNAAAVRIGVLAGSIASAVAGYLVLRYGVLADSVAEPRVRAEPMEHRQNSHARTGT